MGKHPLEEKPCAELEPKVVVINPSNQRSFRPYTFQAHPEFADRLPQVRCMDCHQRPGVSRCQVVAVAFVAPVAVYGGGFRKLEAAAGRNAVDLGCIYIAGCIDDAGTVATVEEVAAEGCCQTNEKRLRLAER